MLCVEFSQVQCIGLSKVVNVLKAVAIVTSEHLNLLTFLWTVTFGLLRCPLNGGQMPVSGSR